KVYGNVIKPGITLINHATGDAERISNLYITNGEKRTEVNAVRTGDIAAAVKLKNTGINETLSEKGDIALAPVQLPSPIVRTAIELKNEGNEDKLARALHQLRREDPAMQVEHNQELHQTIIHGQGEEHLDEIKYALEHRFNLQLNSVPPRIPYRE